MSRSPFARLSRYYPAYRRSVWSGLLYVTLTSALYPLVPLVKIFVAEIP